MPTSSSSSPLSAVAIRGIKWTTAVAITTALLQVGYTSIMARLLDPGAFGLVALAAVVLRFGSYFASMGLDRALVQRAQLGPYDVRATFTAALFIGVGVTGLFWLLAPLSLFVLKNPAVVPLVRVLSLGFVASAAGLTAASLLRREMRFAVLAKIEITAFVVSYGLVGLGSAWAGAGVWSLIAANVSQQLFYSIGTYTAVRHSIRPVRGWHHYKALIGYGSQVSLISFQEFLIGSLDTLLVGRRLGLVALGFYNRAYMLIYLPMYFLTDSVGKVAFPAFSQVQQDLPRLRELYQRSATLVATLVLPICAGVAVAAPEMVRVMLGPKWHASAPVLQALCLAIPLAMTNTFAVIVADVRANLRHKFILNVQFSLLLAGLFWLLRNHGIVGVGLAVGLGEVGRTLLYMRLTSKDIGIGYTCLLALYLPGLRNALGVGAGILVVSAGVRQLGWPVFVVFGLQMLAGALALVTLLLCWPPPELRPSLSQALRRLAALPVAPAWSRARLHYYAQRLAPAVDFAPAPGALVPLPLLAEVAEPILS